MLKNMYEKKINKKIKKINKLTERVFSNWGRYLENADWNQYKNVVFDTDFNFQFNKDKALEISNTVMFDIPSIKEVDIEELKKNIDASRELYESNAGLYMCVFNRIDDDRPFRKVDSLDYIKEYIKNFSKLYAEICNVFVENYRLIYSNCKEAKSSNLDKSTIKEYLNILNEYRKYNRRLFDTFSYILKRAYVQSIKMYGCAAFFIKNYSM